jgi:hypothetical protein
MADIPLTPRPEVRSSANPQPLQVTARPVDQGAGIRPADNSALTGLVNGLSAFNPALERWRQIDDINQTQNAETAGRAAAQKDKSGLPLDLNPAPDAGFQGTYNSIYRNAYRKGIVERAAAEAKLDILSKYNDAKTAPGFNLEQFLKEHRGAHLSGLDNDMAAHMGESLRPLEDGLRHDFESTVRLKNLDIARTQNIMASLQNNVTADDPAAIAQKYREQVLPTILGNGKTKKEGAQYLLGHLIDLSTKVGGRPEIFDTLLNEKDDAGFTIASANPELQTHIIAARQHAEQLQEKRVHEGAQEGIALKLKEMDDRVSKDPNSVTFDELLQHMGKNNVFQTGHEVVSYWNHIRQAQLQQAGQDDLFRLAGKGLLMTVSEKDQKATMGLLTQGEVGGIRQAIESGDTSSIGLIASNLIKKHEVAGSTVPSEAIKNMFEFVGKSTPTGDKAPPMFDAAYEVYRSMKDKPILRDSYFDEKTRKVLEAYGFARDAGEPGAAYRSAYETVSPEAERRAEAFRHTPEFTDKTGKVTKEVTGSSWWPRMLGGNGRPDNAGELKAWAQNYSMEFLKRNPQATEEQALEETNRAAARQFALDSTTGIAVRVPPGESPQAAQEAISAYTKKLIADNGIDKLGSGWNVMLTPSNIEQGRYIAQVAFNGAPQHLIGEVKMSDLVEQHRRDTHWLPQDASLLKQAELAMNGGQPLQDSPALTTALAKARMLKTAGPLVQRIQDYELRSAANVLASRPMLEIEPDTSALFKDNRMLKTDPKQTVSSAQRLLDSSNGGSTGLAASLITMGEAVALRAYDDPAKGAGKNIGMGYNLNANKATAERDLRSAGVPQDVIPGVLNGTLPLSPEQAERLTMVAVGRYETTAAAQVNATVPRLWERLQPQQRAVLTDIAYQTGDVGQFKKALSALVSGDAAKFNEESKVHYTNRKGERVEDVRRNALRASMLQGSAYWQSVLKNAGSQPSGPLDSVALNSPQ